MSELETDMADLWSTSVTTTSHPMTHARARLTAAGVLSAAQLQRANPGERVRVAGVVTHRQRPATASGVTFLNLEDETGFCNVIVSVGCWKAHAKVARSSAAMIIRGRVERSTEGNVTNLVAEHLQHLQLAAPTKSRDFR